MIDSYETGVFDWWNENCHEGDCRGFLLLSVYMSFDTCRCLLPIWRLKYESFSIRIRTRRVSCLIFVCYIIGTWRLSGLDVLAKACFEGSQNEDFQDICRFYCARLWIELFVPRRGVESHTLRIAHPKSQRLRAKLIAPTQTSYVFTKSCLGEFEQSCFAISS